MGLLQGFGPRDVGSVRAYRALPPRSGNVELMGVEGFFASLLSREARFSFEIFGVDEVVSYAARSQSYLPLDGMLTACYPQAQLVPLDGTGRGSSAALTRDWLASSGGGERWVLPLYLSRSPDLPLKFYTDDSLGRGETDPLASILGFLASVSASGVKAGSRLLLQPLGADWSQPYQRLYQRRMDRQDLGMAARPGTVRSREGEVDDGFLPGLSPVVTLAGLGLLALGYFNYWSYQEGILPIAVAADVLGLGVVAGAVAGWRKFFRQDSVRAYFDEDMTSLKLGSQGFAAELQLVLDAPPEVDRRQVNRMLREFISIYRQFEFPAGNGWKPGRARLLPVTEHRERESFGPEPVSGRRMRGSILCPRELATLWHLPVGETEGATIPRAGSRQMRGYLRGLEEGSYVGNVIGSGARVRLGAKTLQRHILLLGKTGMGKSTVINHILEDKLLAKGRGEDREAVVVIDPHADLVRNILSYAPENVAPRIKLLNLGDEEYLAAMNLLDPSVFKDRDRCVAVIIDAMRFLSGSWGPRMHQILDHSLKAIFEYNESTPMSERLSILDILPLLSGPEGRDSRRRSVFQDRVLHRVRDQEVLNWFERFIGQSENIKRESLGPVETRIGAFASNRRSRAILGQWQTTINFGDLLRSGDVLLVSTASGEVGPEVSALMGSTVVSLIDSALREQENLPEAERARCLLVCDEFHTITGTNWEEFMAGIRKYGASTVLSTQSVARLDMPERKLKDGILGNCGGVICYQMSGEDAAIMVQQMGRDSGVSETDLVSLDPFCCYIKLTTSDTSLDPFSMRTRPPSQGDGRAYDLVMEGRKEYTLSWEKSLRAIEDRIARHGEEGRTPLDTEEREGRRRDRRRREPDQVIEDGELSGGSVSVEGEAGSESDPGKDLVGIGPEGAMGRGEVANESPGKRRRGRNADGKGPSGLSAARAAVSPVRGDDDG